MERNANKCQSNKNKNADGPLSGLRVLDIATAGAAPWVATFMADFGAEVIKVEKPVEGDPIRGWGKEKNGIGLFWLTIGRGKKTVTLDLRQAKGRDLLLRLCEMSDVLIENFRPGRLEQWKLGPDVMHKINPELIILRMTGFGQYGPYAERPGFGTLAEAMSGFAHTTGFPDGPPTLPPLPLGDGIAAAFGAYGVMTALHARNTDKVNRGQVIDLALYEGLMRLLEANTVEYDQLGHIQHRTGNRLPQTSPRNAYKTADEKWVAISGSTPNAAERVMKAIGKEDLLQDARFKDNRERLKNAEELDRMIRSWIVKRPLKEVLDVMLSYEVAIGPIYSVEDIFNDPHFKARGTITKVETEEFGNVSVNNVLPQFTLTPGSIKWLGQKIGEYNEEIFCGELGLSKEELTQLQKESII